MTVGLAESGHHVLAAIGTEALTVCLQVQCLGMSLNPEEAEIDLLLWLQLISDTSLKGQERHRELPA